MILTSSYYVSSDYINTFQKTVQDALRLRSYNLFEIRLTYAIDQKYILKLYKYGVCHGVGGDDYWVGVVTIIGSVWPSRCHRSNHVFFDTALHFSPIWCCI